MNKKQTIALFGGSFDPPHIGHEAIVKAVSGFKDIEKVVIMPTFLNPFKTVSHAPPSLRLKWLKKVFSEYKNVEINSYEIEQNKKVPTIQTVLYLLEKYKKIYLVIGADNLSYFHKWDRFEELCKIVTIIVATRNNFTIDKGFLKLEVNENISSTSLRKNIDKKYLNLKCAKEIEKFYKEQNANKN